MSTTVTSRPSARIVWARRILLVLAGLFTLGAFAQFFLAGVAFFDTAARWEDHTNLGHMVGLLTYVMWIPAVLGRAGVRLIVATVVLFALFSAQYAFIQSDNTMAQAFHPLNGSIMLVVGFWITQRSLGLVRRPAVDEYRRRDSPAQLSDELERAST